MAHVENITFEAGFIVVTFQGGGPPRQYPIADVLRAADIPLITYEQVTSIKALANLVVILIHKLIEKGVIDSEETFFEDTEYTMTDLDEVISNMGGDFGDPDLSGSET